jgi:hypothetical protein
MADANPSRSGVQLWPPRGRDENPPPPDHHWGLAAIDFGTSSTTVTLYDPAHKQFGAISPTQRRTLAGALVALMGDEGHAGWPPVAARTEERLRRGLDPHMASRPLGELVATTTAGQHAMLDRLIIELERARDSADGPLQLWLDAALQRSFDAAFREPPLDWLRLFRVRLSAAGDMVDSAAYVESVDPLTVRIGSPGVGDPLAGDQRMSGPIRGLKQQIGRRTSYHLTAAGREVVLSGEDILRGALGDLLDRTHRYIDRERGNLDLSGGRLFKVVVTYPTIASPLVRGTLRELVRTLGVPEVVTRFDEAIAAAMFFLMREFGGSFDPSIDAFRARCHAVADQPDAVTEPRAWEQHVLVIDVGGGTTDIVLLRLRLLDETPPGVRSEHSGRYYRLVPQVLGTSGDTQRGGDYLTLLVFCWIKAIIADHLLRRGDEAARDAVANLDERFKEASRYIPDSLVEAALDPDRSELFSATAEALVPTAWKDRLGADADDRRQTFQLLWDMAEAAKIQLGSGSGPASYRPEPDVLADVLHRVRPSGDADGLSLSLDRELFEKLVEPVLRSVMERAATLVRQGLRDDQNRSVPLDRVVLTGRGSSLAQVSRVLADRFTGKEFAWQPGAIWVEGLRYAKHAASIGACWAETIVHELHPEPAEAEKELRRGATLLHFDVRNLFFYIRGTFKRRIPPGAPPPAAKLLFPVGQPLLVQGVNGLRIARNLDDAGREAWLRLNQGLLGVDLWLSERESVPWCDFRLADHGLDVPVTDQVLDAELPAWTHEIRALVEASEDQSMAILLCRGLPAHRVGPGGTSLREALGPEAHWVDSRIESLLTDVVVNPGIPGSIEPKQDHVVFHSADAASLFTRTFYAAGQPGERPLRGALGEERLPSPNGPGWRFYLRRGGEGHYEYRMVGVLPAPDASAWQEPFFTATLDELGVLRLHAGEPPFEPAASLADVEVRAGAVFRADMTPAEAQYDARYDPFSGRY